MRIFEPLVSMSDFGLSCKQSRKRISKRSDDLKVVRFEKPPSQVIRIDFDSSGCVSWQDLTEIYN